MRLFPLCSSEVRACKAAAAVGQPTKIKHNLKCRLRHIHREMKCACISFRGGCGAQSGCVLQVLSPEDLVSCDKGDMGCQLPSLSSVCSRRAQTHPRPRVLIASACPQAVFTTERFMVEELTGPVLLRLFPGRLPRPRMEVPEGVWHCNRILLPVLCWQRVRSHLLFPTCVSLPFSPVLSSRTQNNTSAYFAPF
eukprot:738336-Rhodomonas_salina.1